ncbi:MAG: hypothetical protein U0T03_12205 [Xanthomonadales bacterium]|nr:hypothetical protein [Xanthomonadales bacterium]
MQRQRVSVWVIVGKQESIPHVGRYFKVSVWKDSSSTRNRGIQVHEEATHPLPSSLNNVGMRSWVEEIEMRGELGTLPVSKNLQALHLLNWPI